MAQADAQLAKNPEKADDWPPRIAPAILSIRAVAAFRDGAPRACPQQAGHSACSLSRISAAASRNFRYCKLLGALGRTAVKNYEQRQSHATSPRHGHPARGPALYDF